MFSRRRLLAISFSLRRCCFLKISPYVICASMYLGVAHGFILYCALSVGVLVVAPYWLVLFCNMGIFAFDWGFAVIALRFL